MLQVNCGNKAQSIVEYAILLGVIFAALAAIQVYSRRGINAAIKLAADQVGTQSDAFGDAKLGDSIDNSDSTSSSSSTAKLSTYNDGAQSWSSDFSNTITASGVTVSTKDKNSLYDDPSSLDVSEESEYKGDEIIDPEEPPEEEPVAEEVPVEEVPVEEQPRDNVRGVR